MKKFIFLAAVVFALSSCSNDDLNCGGFGYINLENNTAQTLDFYVNGEKVTVSGGDEFKRYPYTSGGWVVVTVNGSQGSQTVGQFTLNECDNKTVIVN